MWERRQLHDKFFNNPVPAECKCLWFAVELCSDHITRKNRSLGFELFRPCSVFASSKHYVCGSHDATCIVKPQAPRQWSQDNKVCASRAFTAGNSLRLVALFRPPRHQLRLQYYVVAMERHLNGA